MFCRRDPESLVQPLKQSATDEEKKLQKDALAGKVPTVTRHLILIRHGQYHDREKEDIKRTLTELGNHTLTYAIISPSSYFSFQLLSNRSSQNKS